MGKTGVEGKLRLRKNWRLGKLGLGDRGLGKLGLGDSGGWGTWVGILGWGTGISTCSVSEIVVTMQVACFGNLGMVQHVHRVKKPWLHFVHWLLATGYCIEFTGNFGRMVFGTL